MSQVPRRKPQLPKLPDPLPWKPPEFASDDIYAFKAVATGTANEWQQQHTMRLIIEVLCGTFDMEFRESERASTFAGGKRFVGLQIVKQINLPAELIPERKDHG